MNADYHDFLELLFGYKSDCIKFLRFKTGCDKDQAEDVFIESIYILRQKKEAGELENIPDAKLKSYLKGTCFMYWRRIYFNRKKEVASRGHLERYFYDYIDDEIDALEAERMKGLLLLTTRDALNSLSEKCQRLIRLFYYEGKTMSEIAQLMGFNNATVATTTKYRCFNQLRQKAIEGNQIALKKGY